MRRESVNFGPIPVGTQPERIASRRQIANRRAARQPAFDRACCSVGADIDDSGPLRPRLQRPSAFHDATSRSTTATASSSVGAHHDADELLGAATSARARGRGPRAPPPSRWSAASPAPRLAIAASRSATRTFTSRCGSFSIAWRSARSPPASASSVSSAAGDPVARRDEPHVDEVADCSPPSPPAALRSCSTRSGRRPASSRRSRRPRASPLWKP